MIYLVTKEKAQIAKIGEHKLLNIKKEAITWYQAANFAFKNNVMKYKETKFTTLLL